MKKIPAPEKLNKAYRNLLKTSRKFQEALFEFTEVYTPGNKVDLKALNLMIDDNIEELDDELFEHYEI